MANFTKQITKKFKDHVIDRAKSDFRKCAIRSNKILHKEALNMYKTLIMQFYEYETTSYLRHGEPFVGTGEGSNLLAGGDKHMITMDNSGKKTPKLHIKFSADGMEGGYEYDTPEHVLECVMNGIRFPFGVSVANGKRYGAMLVDPGTLHYSGKYFSFSGPNDGGTIYSAFTKFYNDWGQTSRKVFYSMWGDYVKEWKAEAHKAKLV